MFPFGCTLFTFSFVLGINAPTFYLLVHVSYEDLGQDDRGRYD